MSRSSASRLLQELKAAKTAALSAGDVIRKYYGSNLNVTHKSENQPLTEADLGANACIVEIIKEYFPKDAILSEEIPDNKKRLKSRRVWIIDPLDGTKEFINHVSEFAVSIGLAINKKAVLGVIYNPVSRELFSAAVGVGAFLNNKKIAVKKYGAPLHLATSRTETESGLWKKYAHDFRLTPVGSIAYKMALCAMGKFDGSFTLRNKNEWDICAGTALVQVAGGQVCLADGSKVKFNSKTHSLPHLVYGGKASTKKILSFIKKKKLLQL